VDILVVDDERAVRDSLRRALELEGYRVELAEDGENAIVRWRFAGSHTGYSEALGLNPTKAAVTARGMTWLIVRDGKIVEGWDAWNLGALMNTLQTAATTNAGP